MANQQILLQILYSVDLTRSNEVFQKYQSNIRIRERLENYFLPFIRDFSYKTAVFPYQLKIENQHIYNTMLYF